MRRAGLRYTGGHADRLPAVASVRVLRTFGLWDVSGQLRYESLEGRPYGWLWAGWLAHLVVISLAALGAVALHRSERQRADGRCQPLWLLLVPIGVVVVTAALAYGNQRFRALAEPGVLVLAGTGIAAVMAAAGPTRVTAGRAPSELQAEQQPEPVKAVTAGS